jgi:hypothetical protein
MSARLLRQVLFTSQEKSLAQSHPSLHRVGIQQKKESDIGEEEEEESK